MSMQNRTSLRRTRLSRAMVLALVLPAAGTLMAQEQQRQEEPVSDTTTLDRVTVTGSRIKRAEVEGPSPVTVITREDMDREGFQTVADMLDTLTQGTSINFAGDLSAGGGFTPNSQVVNLRGIGPGYTLVLINGRRMADYPQPYNADRSSVNVGSIPSSVIERVEVLAGGASAIYGSDAIAGVVNIILRENMDYNQVRLTAGTTTNGGGDSVDFEFSGGKVGDRWSATYALQYHANEPIFASQRDFMDDRRDGPNPNASPGLALAIIDLLNGGREAAYPGDEACAAFGFVPFNSASRGRVCGSYDDIAFETIMNKREYVTGYLHGTFDVGDTGQFWGSASWFKADAIASSGTEFWGTSGDPFLTYYGGGESPLYYDAGLNTYVQLQRFLMPQELGSETAAATKFDEETYDLAGGYRNTIADRFDWEINANYARYEYRNDRPRLLAKALHDYFLGPQLGYAGIYPVYELNLERYHTPFTPEQYRAVSTRSVNEGETTSAQANFTISGDLFEMPAGSLGFAGLLEYARNTLDLRSDPYASIDREPDELTPHNLVNSGRTDGKRDRYAAAVEFRVPLLNSLNLQLAGRYDKYNDITAVDDAITYNVGLEWRPFDNLLLRGSYATSFRAPDLQMVYAQGYQFYSAAFDEYACRTGTGVATDEGPRTAAECLANGTSDVSYYTVGGIGTGNPGLKEEEGNSVTFGFVWDVIDGMSLSVDYYRIRLDDYATTEGLSSVLEKEAGCRLGTDRAGNPYPYALDSQFCQNVLSQINRQSALVPDLDTRLVSVRTSPYNTSFMENSGIDTSFEYQWDTDRWGDFRLETAYSILMTDKFRQFEGDDTVEYRDYPSQYANQRSRVRGSLRWRKDDWTTTVFGTRYGTVWSYNLSQRLTPLMLWNFTVTKQFGENVAASLIVNNVFDKHYRYDPNNTVYPFFLFYQGADPVGRSVFARLSYRF